MATVVPYTWTQGRIVQPWADPAPSPGQWWPNPRDASYIAGVTAVYLAVPFWLAMDFTQSMGKTLVLLSAPTDDGQRGRLRVYRGDGTYEPATLTDYTEPESNDVSGAAIGCRGSSEVDVFYIHGGSLKHRRSSDGGVTFGSATSHSLTGTGAVAFTPAQSTYPAGSTNGAFVEAEGVCGGYVHFDYLPGNALAMVIHGRLAGAVSDDPHIVRADWDGSDWTFGTIAKLTGALTATDVFGLRTGDVMLTSGQVIQKLANAGTFTLGITGNVSGAGVSETINQRIGFGGTGDVGADSDGSGTFYYRRLLASSLNSARTQWTLTGTAANTSAEKLKSWRQQFVKSPNPDANFGCRRVKARFRSDRRWEVLYLNRDQKPEIVRFKSISAAVAPLAWY